MNTVSQKRMLQYIAERYDRDKDIVMGISNWYNKIFTGV